MKKIRTLKEFKRQLKYSDKEKVIEMFYNAGLKLIEVEQGLKKIVDDKNENQIRRELAEK